MLLRFALTNFGVFRSRAELSFVAAPIEPGDDTGAVTIDLAGKEIRVLSAVGILGANASGKTTLLAALGGLGRAVEASQRTWVPDGGVPSSVRRPHALAKAKPTIFEIDCFVSDMRYRYECGFSDRQVVYESLRHWETRKPSEVFRRDKSGEVTIGRGRSELRAARHIVRPNSLFLSAAVQNGAEALLPLYRWLTALKVASEDNDSHREVYAAHRLLVDRSARNRLVGLLRSADVGVEDAHAKRVPLTEQQRKIYRALNETSNQADPEPVSIQVELVHTGSGDSFVVPYEWESAGTQGLLRLAFPLFDTMDRTELLLVDEFERSLHPLMTRALLKTFLEKRKDGSQLLFSTHDEALLKVLRRDAVWFTEKDNVGEARLVPLSDFHVRHQLDLSKAYLQNRFGGVPELPPVLQVGRGKKA